MNGPLDAYDPIEIYAFGLVLMMTLAALLALADLATALFRYIKRRRHPRGE
jgi:hypothetical protein